MTPARRVYDWMKGLGFGFGGGGGEMVESEPEEGEAWCGMEEDACIDPDVDLSYIDEKLKDVLGHLQSDFEGGFSADNLGAKFGGYGSFLPSYKRSPSILSLPRSPPKDSGHTVVRSHVLSCEGTRNDSSVQTNVSFSKNISTLTKDPDLGGSARKDASTTATTTRNHIQDDDLIDKGSNCAIQNTLKVRIKIGPDNISARNNAAIYSGLGLELSPSSSLEDSPEGSRCILEEDGIPSESPKAILQMMTDFPISEECFLSPLQENLLRLTEAGDRFSENHRGDLPGKSIPEVISVSGQLTAPLRSTETCRETPMKPLPENIQIGGNKSKLNYDTRVILEKKVNVDTPEGQELTFLTSSMPLPLISGTCESKIMVREVVSKTQEDLVKVTKKTSDQQIESSTMLLNDNTFHSGLGKRNTSESKKIMESDGIAGLKEAASIKAKPSPRNLTRGDSVEKNMICGKNVLSCMQKECIDKPENCINFNEVELGGPKANKDNFFGTNEFVKLNSTRETDKLPEIKGKLKVTAANATSVTSPPKKTMVSLSLFSGKEEKKLHARGDPAENKSKRVKLLKESLHDYPKQSQREVAWEGKGEQVVGRTEPTVTPLIAKNRIKDVKITKKKSRVRSVDNKSGSPLSFEAPVEACMDALVCDHSASNAAVAPGPIVIKDNWACCDICEKWRLLPNGTNPDDLPKKWTCSMQFWLPIGMNSCIINEEETTKIMNPQCHISLQESSANLDHSAPLTSSATVHVNQVTLEKGSRNHTDCTQVRRLSDTSMERRRQKLKAKGENLQRSSDGVDIISRRGKDLKLISKGLINSDISGAKKIMNPNDFHHLNKDGKLSPALAAKVAPYLSNGSSAADLTGKKIGEIGDKFLSNSMRDLKGSCSSLNGTLKAHLGVHTGQEFKQVGVIDTRMSDNSVIPAKKRKASEWHDIQNNKKTPMRSKHLGAKRVMVGEDTSGSAEKKENKGNGSNSEAEYSRSKMTGTMDKSHDKTRKTSRIGELFIDGMGDGQVSAHGQLGQHESRVASEQPCDFTTVQPSAGGNSSSCRNKANVLESRGSPLHSVSSSPLRVYSSEKLSKIRNSVGKTDAKNLGASSIERSKICSDGEVNGEMSQVSRRKEKKYFIQQNFLGSSQALSPLDGACNNHVKASFSLDDGKGKSGIPSSLFCGGVRDNVLPSEVGGINVVNSMSIIPDKHDKHLIEPPNKKPFQNQDKLNEAPGNDEDRASSHCDEVMTVISESGKRLCFRDRNNTPECEFNKGKMKLSNVFSEQEELHSLRNGKQGTPNRGPLLMPNVKAKGLEVYPTGETVSGLLELDKLAKDSDKMNVARHGSLKLEKVNELDGQYPMRKCAPSSAALVAMKEAKELKHAADRRKNVGQELEGTALYFQAALKFLQAASLSEPSSVVNIKYEELNESLMTYTQTAALCEFCAREFEKRKDMALAALAYKCMEVAYFKVAFFKNHVASKDHHELQTAIQTFWQGDSPSSSASDLDNLNQLGAVEKAIYSKAISSLQIIGHLIASRPSFTRWLDYTNISISALEASRKSQNALSAASASLEKSGCDSIASVKEALNFNFHNVEELLRRIRAAMESCNS